MKTNVRLLLVVGLMAALFACPPLQAQERDVPHRLQGEIKDISRDKAKITVKGEETTVTVHCGADTSCVEKAKGAGAELKDFHEGDKVMLTYVKTGSGRLLCLELAEKGTKVYKEEKEEGR